MTCNNVKKTATRITDSSIGTNGSLEIRLNNQFDHLPQIPQIKKARCGLHRWVGVEVRGHINFCATCNVNFCIQCYKMFHQNSNLLQSKHSIKNQYNPNLNK